MRALLLGLLVACGGGESGVDLTGIYQVDSAVGSTPCGADAEISYAAFVKFERMEIFEAPFYVYEDCADAAGTDCVGNGGLFGGFAEPIEGGWRGVLTSSSGGGDLACLLGYSESTATLDGGALTIERSEYSEEVPGLTEEQCDPDEAERRNTSMGCDAHELVIATKL